MMDSAKILAGLPAGLRDPLLETFRNIAANFAEHRWEPSELNGGKFCEVVFTILDGSSKGTFASTPFKPKNMADACWALEEAPPKPAYVGDRSLRVLVPRMLLTLYEIRNNRGVGHVGGDINPNLLDATAVYAMASWILAELVRIFHNVSTREAQEIVDMLVERKHPLIWEVEDVKRVLDPTMLKRDQALVLLHQRPGWVAEVDLRQWIEHSNPSVFRKKILMKLHAARLIEFDEGNGRARISPTGSIDVEKRILKPRLQALM